MVELRRRLDRNGPVLDPGPVALPTSWVEHVNRPQTHTELDALRRCLARGAPYGAETWQEETAEKLGLQTSLRPRGRPRRKAPP